jgi:hypothetical protein
MTGHHSPESPIAIPTIRHMHQSLVIAYTISINKVHKASFKEQTNMSWLVRRLQGKQPKYSKDTMQQGTGKTYDEWVNLLDVSQQRKQSNASVRQYLMDKHQLSPAWARTIASYYQMR